MYGQKRCLWCGRVSRTDELDMNEHDEPSYCPECGHDQFTNYIPEYETIEEEDNWMPYPEAPKD